MMEADEAWERGRSAWPGLAIDRQRFAGHLKRHCAQTVVYVEELYLAFGCAERLPSAIASFERDYMTSLVQSLSELDASQEELIDVQMELRHELLVGDQEREPRIAAYAGRSPLKRWLGVLAIKSLNGLRTREAKTVSTAFVNDRRLASSSIDPELSMISAQARSDLELSLRSAFNYEAVFERSLIKLDVIEILSVDELRRIRRAHRATVAVCLEALQRQLLVDMLDALQPRVQLDRADIQSLIALVCG